MSLKDSVPLTEAERNLLMDVRPPLYRFVFTGGPCGGKTTALARVFSYLRERHFEVINCPEAYTILNSNGMSTDFFSTDGMSHVIQGTVLDVQLALENGVERVLKARGKPAVILCDRGTMDGSVYVSKEDFQKVMDERSTDVVALRDNRYDACFHMVTAADGAEPYYTLENNKVRHESKEDARKADQLTQRAWCGHPHLYVIDNSTDFEGKMSRLVDIISKIVGLPSNMKRRSAKFLLKSRPDHTTFPPEIDFQVFEVEKVYLQRPQNSPDAFANSEYSFIRRRSNVDRVSGQVLGSVFQITSVKRIVKEDGTDEVIEQKRIMSQREYATAYESRDPRRHVLQQRRISFLYEKQSFNVHMYESPISGIHILHAQVEAKSNPAENDGEHDPKLVTLPPFLEVDRRLEDTEEDEKKYGAYNISLIERELST
jgi:nucleoside-triphosphatase THEP1